MEHMKRGYYIHFGARRGVGVDKKITTQIIAFRQHFDMQEINVPINPRSFLRKIYEINPFVMGRKYDLEYVYQRIDNPSFVYIRLKPADKQYMTMLKYFKEKYPRCVVIVEAATFPYDKELSPEDILRDRYNRRHYKKYVDYFITYTDNDKIFDVPTIRIRNGVEVDDFKVVNSKCVPERISLIAVSTMQPIHGYERVLYGLDDYYKKGGTRDIVIYMVGKGKELNYYKKIVSHKKLEKHVIFTGEQRGDKLDELYNMSDMVLTTFGFYKTGVKEASVLKSREALAKGLPVVNGITWDVFSGRETPYNLDFPNDSSKVDFFSIVDFYDKLYNNQSKANLANKIHEFAKKEIDISVTFEPVISLIQREIGG